MTVTVLDFVTKGGGLQMTDFFRDALGRSCLLIVLWLAVVTTGFGSLMRYKSLPGEVSASPRFWPETTLLRRDSSRSTLLMIAHPKCPCTYATLREIEWIQSKAGRPVDVQIVFALPPGADESWRDTDVVRLASSYKNMSVQFDESGKTVENFDANTSGQVFLYDTQGKLQFSGGVTPMRGHEGDCPGKANLLAAIQGKMHAMYAPAFGCPLRKGSRDL